MARLVGIGLHNLQNLRRLQLLSSPYPAASREIADSKQDVKRRFGESATLEEVFNSTLSVKESLGYGLSSKQNKRFEESAALEEIFNSSLSGKESLGVKKTLDANPGQSLKKQCDESENKVVSEEGSVAGKSATPSGAAARSSDQPVTEKMTEYIIENLKPSANSTNGNKAFVNKKHAGHTSSKFQFSQGGSNRSVDDKSTWKEVVESLCKRAAKNKADIVGQSSSNQSSSSGKSERNSIDDFADLDLPQERDKAGVSGSSNSSSRPSLFDAAFKKEPIINSRHKESQPQDWNQQKAKETKPVHHEFPKSARVDMSERNLSKREDTVSRPVSSEPRIFPIEDSSHRVCIQNLPVNSNLALVRDALSIYGEVTGSYKKPTSNGSCACYIEFKTYEAKEDALAARSVQLENKIFSILRVDRPVTTVVRVGKVSSESTESHMLSTCGKFGSIDIIKRRGIGIFDVYYNVRELPNIPKILESLNEVTIQRSRWSALPAPLLHPALKESLLRRREGQAWHLSQMNRLMNRIEVGLDNVAVWFEDLKTLNSMEEESRRS